MAVVETTVCDSNLSNTIQDYFDHMSYQISIKNKPVKGRDLPYIKLKKSNIIHALSLLYQTAPGVWKSDWNQIRHNIITLS